MLNPEGEENVKPFNLEEKFNKWRSKNIEWINKPTITSLLYDINLLPEQVLTFRSNKMASYCVAVVEHFKMFEKEVKASIGQSVESAASNPV